MNISSIIGQRAFPGSYIYCASKAAVDQLTRCMAVELGPHNIRVNAVLPSTVASTHAFELAKQHDSSAIDYVIGRTPLKQLPETSDIVNAALFLLSDNAKMVSGTFVQVDGGFLST